MTVLSYMDGEWMVYVKELVFRKTNRTPGTCKLNLVLF